MFEAFFKRRFDAKNWQQEINRLKRNYSKYIEILAEKERYNLSQEEFNTLENYPSQILKLTSEIEELIILIKSKTNYTNKEEDILNTFYNKYENSLDKPNRTLINVLKRKNIDFIYIYNINE